jgi:hypothetical protein
MTDSALKHFAAHEHSFSLGGVPIEGWGEDSSIEWTRGEAIYTRKSGLDAQGTRSMRKQPFGQFKLTLMQTSASNDYLMSLHLLDQATPGGAGVVPFLFKNNLGRTLIVGAEAWVIGEPDEAIAGEAGEREWLVDVYQPKVFLGGS